MPQFSGYNDSKNQNPNIVWWEEQIKAGEKFRKDRACESEWETWRSYYRGDFNSTSVLPINIFFSIMNSLVPRVYFRNPTVSLSPGVPGLEAMMFARVLQRIDNKMLTMMGVKQQIKQMIRDAFLFGTGVGKMGFGGIYNTGIMPYQPGKEPTEYLMLNQQNMPWFRSICPGDFVVPHGIRSIGPDTRWVAYKMTRPLDDVRADERFVESARKSLVSKEFMKELDSKIPVVELYEVQDRKTGMSFVIAPKCGGEKALYVGPDAMQQIMPFSALPLIFNENDNCFWGVPDSKIIEPYQLELNETNTQIMKHRRTSIIKLLAQRGAIKEEEVEKFLSEEVEALVWTEDDPKNAINVTQSGTIPPEFRLHVQDVLGNVRETVGFSRNQMGEFNSRSGDTTATEANIVAQSMEIRVDERRDIAADLLVQMVDALHQLMFITLPDQIVVDMAGPNGAIIWVQFKKDLIRTGRYTVVIDPDSTQPQTQEMRQQRARENYQLFQANPLIDPLKLTQYALSETMGNQFDDMLNPQAVMLQQQYLQGGAPGSTPQNPMQPGQYAEVQQQNQNAPVARAPQQ